MTDAGAAALLEPPPAATAIVVLFRPGRGRWKKVGSASTVREALDLLDQSGDWWLRTTTADAPEPGLFDGAP